MTWIEARRVLREEIEKFRDFRRNMRARFPDPDPRCLNNTQYSAEHRSVVAMSLADHAIRDCSSQTLHDMLIGLNDPDRIVRGQVGAAFGACGYEPAVEGLIRLLRECKDNKETEDIGFILTAIGRGAVPALLDLMMSLKDSGRDDIFIAAGRTIISMGPDVVDWLLETFLDRKSERWGVTLPILASRFQAEAESKLVTLMNEANNVSNRILAMRVDLALRFFRAS